MTASSPTLLIDTLIAARSRGEIETALACYEQDATIVAQPGQVLRGTEDVRGVLEYFASLHPTFEVHRRTFVETDGLVLHASQWTLRGTDTAGQAVEFSGTSTDVLRRQVNGSWLMAIDNPWGLDSSPE